MRRFHPVAIGLGLAFAVLGAGAAIAQDVARDQLVARMTAWTRLPKRAVVSVKPDVMVAILRPGVRTRDLVEGVLLQSESADEAAAQAAGWRSMRSEIDISCATRSNRFHYVVLYSNHNLTGTARAHTPPTGWIHPTAKAYMFDVIAAVCGPDRPGAAPTTIASEVPMASGSSAPPINVAQAAAPRHATTLVGADLPEADAPMPSGRPVAVVAATPPPRPAPTTPRLPATPATTVPSQAPRRPGVGVVQIAAFPTAAESEQALGAFAQTQAGQSPGLSRRIETARVKGVLYYRAVIAGFGSTAEASALCAEIKKSGGDCFVRP